MGIILLLVIALLAGTALLVYRTWNLKGEYFDSNGVRIHYVVRGHGTPVVLMHGLGVTMGGNWAAPRILQRLSKRYQIIALDARGHGRSGKPHDPAQYGTEMAEDIVRLMDHLKIEKAHVIGYSMGGFIVLKLAMMHPDRLLSVAPCGAGWSARIEKDLPFVRQVAKSLDQGNGFGPLLDRLQPVGKPPSRFTLALTNWLMTVLNDVRAMAAVMHGMEKLDVSQAELRGNRVPALAIIGEKDPLKEYADQLAAVMANLEYVVIPGGDHLTALGRCPTMPTIQSFLARHTPESVGSQ
jgi:pimeloyl-ACP methyl ester carboxylesterase